MKRSFVARLLAKRLWTPGRIDRLIGDTVTTLTTIAGLFDEQQVEVHVAGERKVAWGQYLDRAHFSETQWGFYGTSSALQTLAIRAHRVGRRASADPDVAQAMALPEDRDVDDRVFADKREKNDFENVIKLAYIADGLCLDEAENVPTVSTPRLVQDLVGLAIDGEGWTTRLVGERDRRKDRDFATALVVSVLRRYEFFRNHELWNGSRRWLANRVVNDAAFREQTTLLALTGLALLPHPKEPDEDPAVVTRALDTITRELLRWVHGAGSALVLNRPVFNGFSIGRRNDYVFLHPELLAAVFLIRHGLPPRGRRFVLDVVDALQKNVSEKKGFMGQDGMITSVDQLWATRLIAEIQRIAREPGAKDRLLPRPDAYLIPGTWKTAIGWIALLLLVAGLLAVLVNGWVGLVPIGVGIVFLVIGKIRPSDG